MPIILDGRIAATEWRESFPFLNFRPTLAIIQVGSLSSSNVFIRRKINFGQTVGAEVNHQQLSEKVSTHDLVRLIRELNNDSGTHGIIVQLPLPPSVDRLLVIEAIDPRKDVDGLTSTNLKLLWNGDPRAIVPATARGILRLLDHYQIQIAGTRAVVIGRSGLVGKPTALSLLNRQATVTICHRQTGDLAMFTKEADLIVSATGFPSLITATHVRAGQTVVDVGITVLENGLLAGDVDFRTVAPVVRAISPVPGGVGPMTVAALFANLFDSVRLREEIIGV